jgi:hypothetical protein
MEYDAAKIEQTVLALLGVFEGTKRVRLPHRDGHGAGEELGRIEVRAVLRSATNAAWTRDTNDRFQEGKTGCRVTAQGR